MTLSFSSRTVRRLAAAAPLLAWPLAQAQGASGADNPYGIAALWQQSDIVARSVLLILAAMSIGSWYVIVTKLFEQLRIGSHAKSVAKSFWEAGTVQAGAGRFGQHRARVADARSQGAAVPETSCAGGDSASFARSDELRR